MHCDGTMDKAFKKKMLRAPLLVAFVTPPKRNCKKDKDAITAKIYVIAHAPN